MIPKSNLNDIVSFISLFRNSIIRLPIPVEFISIPCIIAIYIRISKMKSTAQGKDI